MATTTPPCITLTDNGSYRPAATLSLRRLAAELGERSEHVVNPVSLLHSTKIPAEKLEGQPAHVFESFALAKREEGVNSFLVVPLFFGPSAAIAEYLPQRADVLREEHQWPELEVRVCPSLVNCQKPEDKRMVSMLADLVRQKRAEIGVEHAAVALVDHGAPRIEVTQVRNFLADQLREVLGDEASVVTACSMERREGEAYAFNEPLLEVLLGSEGFRHEVIVSMLFLQPGRHAGAGGDVANICQDAEKVTPGLQTHMTELVGTHPLLLDILVERLEQGLLTDPVSWKAMQAASATP